VWKLSTTCDSRWLSLRSSTYKLRFIVLVELWLVRLGHVGRVRLGDGDGLYLQCVEGLLGRDGKQD
jgi:hypothetical protein